jgi:hypothetical protein
MTGIDDFLAEVERAMGGAGPDAVVMLRGYLEAADDADAALAAMGDPRELAAKMVAAGAGHRHLDAVVLPGGVTVWAASFPHGGYDRANVPDFGLYLDARWAPPWPHAHVDWPDFGVPADPAALRETLAGVLDRARRGKVVEVGCLGGHGRTGTALACLAVLAGLDAGTDAVAWVRGTYCPNAVETEEQVELVRAIRP